MRTIVLTVALGVTLGVSTSVEARTRTSRTEWRRILSDVRDMARGSPTLSQVDTRLRNASGMDSAQLYYLARLLEDRFPREADRERLVEILQSKWVPNRRLASREPIYLAYMRLRASAVDGKLTASEVDGAEAALVRLGVDRRAASQAVEKVKGFRSFAAALEAGRRPAPPPPRRADLDVLERILAEEFRSRAATWVDQNQDGRIDGRDMARVGGRDVVLGKERARRILLQLGMVKSAKRLVNRRGGSRMEFLLIHQTKMDRTLFRPNGRSFILQPGVRPSRALDSLFTNAERYGMECATAISVLHYAAIREAYRESTGSDALFDDHFRDMRIGQLTMGTENHLRRARQHVGGQIRIGDHGYFSTPDVDPAARRGGWNGENVIYLGGDRYFGHPFGITDSATIIDKLNSVRRRIPNPRPATLNTGQIRLDPGPLWDD